MSEISQLIETVVKDVDEEEAAAAALRLAEIGMPAVPEVIAAIRKSEGAPPPNLRNIIPLVRDPEVVPAMLEVLHEKETYLPLVAFRTLGAARDARAFQPVLSQFLDEKNSDTTRAWAADALGEMGDERAVPHLLGVVEGFARAGEVETRYSLALKAVVALAKLGNHESAGVAIALAGNEDPSARGAAAGALQYVVGAGLFPALQKALRDELSECQKSAIDAVFYLGLPESVEELVACYEEGALDSGLMEKALGRIRDLTGEEFEDEAEAEEVRDWWEQHRAGFAEQTCPRLGRPLRVSDVCALLESTVPGRHHWLLEELRVITGESFAVNPFGGGEGVDEAAARAQEWGRKESHRFEAGALYKYGHRLPLRSVF